MTTYREIFQRNRNWVARMTEQDPGFFERLAEEHDPHFLWIGCSDARVPANVITGTPAGEMFVHRNIANQVMPTCANTLAVIEYAVEVLGVEDIIVCGHEGCGGVKAALDGLDDPSLQHVHPWLANLRMQIRLHADELDALRDDPERRAARMVELNVIEQVHHLRLTPVVREAWSRGATLRLHGLVYKLREGMLRDLHVTVAGPDGRLIDEPTESATQPPGPSSRPDDTRPPRHASDTSRDTKQQQQQQQQRGRTAALAANPAAAS